MSLFGPAKKIFFTNRFHIIWLDITLRIPYCCHYKFTNNYPNGGVGEMKTEDLRYSVYFK